MITVTGNTHREFTFPATPKIALRYYSNLEQLVRFLPHITLIKTYTQTQARMLYKTRELGLYTVYIYCDLQQVVDQDNLVLHMQPYETLTPVNSQSHYNATIGHGRFRSQSQFYLDGNQTRIDYHLELEALLPPPKGLRFVPGAVLDQIAYSITKGRIREIADGFIQQSIAAFPLWQTKNKLT